MLQRRAGRRGLCDCLIITNNRGKVNFEFFSHKLKETVENSKKT